MPYAFSTPSTEFAVGIAAGTDGFLQEQAGIFGTTYYSANDSYGGFLMLKDLQLPTLERGFIDVRLVSTKFAQKRIYIDRNPAYPEERAGSNNSSKYDFLDGIGHDKWTELDFKYVLPIGHGQKHIIHSYKVNSGLLESNPSGADTWNPFQSGRTIFRLTPFVQDQKLVQKDPDDKLQFKTNGLEAAIVYNNFDYDRSPSRGNRTEIAVARDFGWANSTNS